MNAKKHYEEHLSHFYSWMIGDFEAASTKQSLFFEVHGIKPLSTSIALDLGAGNGIQTYALAKAGFRVKSLDFNARLLEELKTHCTGLDVETIEDDILSVIRYSSLKPELIVCMGDTLTHLETEGRIETFLEHCADTLIPGGKLVLSFRDYSEKLSGDKRFIPVKSDDKRILTCFLDYLPTHVMVTDLLHEYNGAQWEQKVSSYTKVRISPEEVCEILENNGLKIVLNTTVNGMVSIIARK